MPGPAAVPAVLRRRFCRTAHRASDRISAAQPRIRAAHARLCNKSAQGAGAGGRSVGGRWYKLDRALGAACREPSAHRAGRAAPRPGPERAHGGDRCGQDGARPRARPAARRARARRHRAPGRRRGLRGGRLRAAGRAARRARRAPARRRRGDRARAAGQRRGPHAGLSVRALGGRGRPARRGRGAAVLLRPARAPQAHARLLAARDPRRLLRGGAPGAPRGLRGGPRAGARARGDPGGAARARRGARARARPARLRAAGDRGGRSIAGGEGRAGRRA